VSCHVETAPFVLEFVTDREQSSVIALQLLGGFRAVQDDGRLILVPERARALLAYLAMADSAVPRAVLASLLSSDECEQDQRRNLRQALYVTRQAVGPDAIVCTGQGDLHLNEVLLRADVCKFRRAIASGDEQSAVQAIALYQGSFLQGEAFRSSDFEDWLRSRRGELLDTVVRALVRVARLELDRGHFDHALAHTRRALELDPLCEEAHRQAIRCLAALGERSNALRHYEAARQLFRNELGVSLDARTDELRQALADESGSSKPEQPEPASHSDLNHPHSGSPDPVIPTLARRIGAKAVPVSIGLGIVGAAVVVSMAMTASPEPRLTATQTLPTVAVLPFGNASGDQGEAVIGYGIAEELTAMLASHPGLSVLSPSRAKRFEPDADPGEVRRQSGVRYVLNGGIRRSGPALKITARLTDAQTGFQVWSTQLEGEDNKLDEIQQRIAEIIDETLVGFAGTIAKEEQRQAWSKPDRDLLEQDYVRRGEQFAFKFTPDAHVRAREIWHEGLARFPDSVRLRIALAFLYRYAAEAGHGDLNNNLTAACGLGREAEQVPRKTQYEDWLSHWLTAKLAQWCDEDFQRSITEIEAAITLAPYDASARADLAELLANTGQSARAVEWLHEAIRRDPRPPDWYYRNLAWAYYLDGRSELALQALQTRRSPRPDALLAVILARSNRNTEAHAAVEEYQRLNGPSKLQGEMRRPLVANLKAKWISDLVSTGLTKGSDLN
jgi:DNA-binding SARP family transcriptional activator/TolB-like protein